MRKIKIVTVYNSLNFGGTEKYIKDLYNSLDEEKFDFSIVCLLDQGKDAKYYEDRNIPVYTFNAFNSSSLKYVIRNSKVVLELYRLFKREKFDIVHSHDFFPATIARLAAVLADTSIIIITYHNLFFWLKTYHHFINKILAYKTEKIIAVSNAVKKFSIRHDKIPEKKFEVIYNGVDFSSFSQGNDYCKIYEKEFGFTKDDFVIGTIGTFSFRKGQKYLLEAFAIISRKYKNIKLIFVGGDENEPAIKKELDEIIRINDLKNKIIFTGSRIDINKLIFIFDLFISPSIVEGFGYTVVEAMAAKRPIIVSNIQTYKEITKDGSFGLLFESKNSGDLVEKIEYAISNIDQLKAKAEEAFEYAKENFELKNIQLKYKEFFERISQLIK